MKIKRSELFVCISAFLFGVLIAYAHLYIFRSELNPNFVTQPYLLDKGFIIYEDLGDQKPPLLLLFIAWLLPLFRGDAATAARTLHFVIIVLVVVLCLVWVNRQAGQRAALFSGLFMLAWSNVFGFWATAYYDLAISPFFLLFFMLLVWENPEKLFVKTVAGGVLTGIALLIKQHAAILGLFFLLGLIFRSGFQRLTFRQIATALLVFLVSLAFPILLLLAVYLRQAHTLDEFIFWNFTLLTQNRYSTLASIPITPEQLGKFLQILVMLAPFGVAILFPFLGERPPRAARFWLLAFFMAAIFFQYPRYSNRHWAVAFPFAAMISGFACEDIIQLVKRKGAYLLFAVLLLAPAWWAYRAGTLYLSSWQQPAQMISEYSDLFYLAQDLQGRIPSEGSLVIFPTDESNANLHYILQRPPPHYFTYHYPWFMNNEHVKERWIEALEEEQPPVLLYFPARWDVEIYAPGLIDYVNQHYEIKEIIEWNGIPIQIMLRKNQTHELTNQ